MSPATTAKTQPAPSAVELFPAMRFMEKLYVFVICCALLVPAIIFGWKIAGPVDPDGAVTFVYHPNPPLAILGMIVYAAVGSAVATFAMRGRLMDFGVFAVGVGLTGLALRGGGLTDLLQYEAVTPEGRGPMFVHLSVDVLFWTIIPAAAYAVCAMTESWAGLTGPAKRPAPAGKSESGGILARWLQHAAARTATAADWRAELRQGPLATVITVVLAVLVIHMAGGEMLDLANDVQACFAIGAGFWIGAMVAGQFCRPALGLWTLLAVPIVALLGTVFAAVQPGLPAAFGYYRDVVIVAPNALVRGLPVMYLAVGPAAVVLGIWTGQRIQRAREEAAES